MGQTGLLSGDAGPYAPASAGGLVDMAIRDQGTDFRMLGGAYWGEFRFLVAGAPTAAETHPVTR